MTLSKAGYRQRLIDQKIDRYLRVFGAVSLEGPKWCGKTWTSLNHANSVTYMTEQSARDLARVDPKYIFTGDWPQLIDEWQIVPGIWDAVRHACDQDQKKGKFILTGSTSLWASNQATGQVFHSGAGRIAPLRMSTMSLYESGDSTGQASIENMLKGHIETGYVGKTELPDLARFIVKGGWPENLNIPDEDMGLIPQGYIEAILSKDMHNGQAVKRNPDKMRMLLRALARNETTVAGDKTLIRDMEDYANEDELIASRQTLSDYLAVLDSLYLRADQPAFSIHYRSSARVGKSSKRHLVDPSLCCACLGLTVPKLMHDHETFGLLFEALAERDLRIYGDALDARLYHFRDNVSGDEVDAILEFPDGRYGAFEIKLTNRGIDEAIAGLETFQEHVARKPAFRCVLVGYLEAVMQDPETGIFVVPLTTLKP